MIRSRSEKTSCLADIPIALSIVIVLDLVLSAVIGKVRSSLISGEVASNADPRKGWHVPSELIG